MIKEALFFLSLPIIGFCSTYNEVVPLPQECYPTDTYFPDMVTLVPKCIALSDFQAHRPEKNVVMFFKVYYKGCSNVSEASPVDVKIACRDSYLNYVYFYEEVSSYTKKFNS